MILETTPLIAATVTTGILSDPTWGITVFLAGVATTGIHIGGQLRSFTQHQQRYT